MERDNGRKKDTRNTREGRILVYLQRKETKHNRKIEIDHPQESQLERCVSH